MSALTIGIAGTHSSGKSTFVEMLATRFALAGVTVGVVGDLAAAARDAGFPILREHTIASTAWIVARGISLELEQSLRSSVVLVDRPAPDALGYLKAALRFRREALGSSDDGYIRDLVSVHSRSYHQMLLSEVDYSLPIDLSEERDADPVFRRMADEAIIEVFAELKLPHVLLSPKGRDIVADQLVADVRRRLEHAAGTA